MRAPDLFTRGVFMAEREGAPVQLTCSQDCDPLDGLTEFIPCPQCGTYVCFGHSVYLLGPIVLCKRHQRYRCWGDRDCKRYSEACRGRYVCATCGGADVSLLAPIPRRWWEAV